MCQYNLPDIYWSVAGGVVDVVVGGRDVVDAIAVVAVVVIASAKSSDSPII